MGGEKWGHILHFSHTTDVPLSNVAVEGVAQEEAHVRHERHLRDKIRAGCGGQGVGAISHGRGCGGQHGEWVHKVVLTSQELISP